MLKTLVHHLVTLTPLLTAQDVYKAIYQMCMGVEHALLDQQQALLSLQHEFASVVALDKEPLLQPLGRDIYRLHLRPAKYYGVTVDEIAKCFFATANLPPNRQRLIELTTELAHISYDMGDDQAVAYLKQIEMQDYPSVSHTTIYKEHHQPAYRVVHRLHIPKHWFELAKKQCLKGLDDI